MYVCISDVDGTIINSHGELSKNTIDTMIRFQEDGNLLILASGRSYLRMMDIAKNLKMDKFGGYLIDVNGISIYDFKNNERKRFSKLENDELNILFRYFKQMNVELKFYCDDAIFTYLPRPIFLLKENIRREMKLPDDYPWTSGEYGWFADMRSGYPKQKLIQDISEIDEIVNKIGISHDHDELIEVRNNFKKSSLGNEYNIMFSGARQLDVIQNHLSKGGAVKALLKKIKIKITDKIYVFGDSENDISMLESFENSYVMENSSDYVKSFGFKIAKSNNDDGLAEIIKALI